MDKNSKFGGIELRKQKFVVIRAVATLESKSSTAQVDGERSNKLDSGLSSGSVSVGEFDELAYSSGEESEELDEKEKLRRMRISKANKGNTPWNLGRKHSPETLKRIRERTRIAMQSPKVKMKLATLGHAQSEETKLKIGVGVRAGWERRRERLRLQETCYFEWQNLIAEAGRKGSASERELQWNSYKVLDKELEQEWLQSVEQRKNTPKPKGNKRAPKSPEQRRKISEAISAKWADAEYRERVCSALSKYYGTPEGEGRKPRRRASCEREPKVRTPRKKKDKETAENADSSGKSSIKKRSKIPKFKDPLASSKLEMIKNIRAQRAVVELKKTEAFKQAKELIREAERAANALEANATRSPLAQASLIESRELIAQAIQSLNSIKNGHVDVFNENDTNPLMGLEESANDASKTDHGVAVNGFGKSKLTSLIDVNSRDEDENRFIVNGLSCDFEDENLLSLSEDEIEEEEYATAFTGEQLRDQLVRLNGKINSNSLFQNETQVVRSSDNGEEEEEEGNIRTHCSETGTKKWVRGKLVDISKGSD